MELPCKLLEQIAFNTRPKIEELILNIMDKSTHEEYLFQPLQTNNKQFKIAVTFLSGYNGTLFQDIYGIICFISRNHLLKKILFKIESPMAAMKSNQ